MPTYKIRGIDVEFPFEAYDCQLVYMEKVIQSLQNVSLPRRCGFVSIVKIHFSFSVSFFMLSSGNDVVWFDHTSSSF